MSESECRAKLLAVAEQLLARAHGQEAHVVALLDLEGEELVARVGDLFEATIRLRAEIVNLRHEVQRGRWLAMDRIAAERSNN